MGAAIKIEVGTERPLPRHQLPIRAVRNTFNGFPSVTLIYTAPTADGQESEYQRVVGPPLDDPTPGVYRDPLGVAVLRLMQEFFKMEAERDGLLQQRDEAILRERELEGELAKARGENHGRPRGAMK